MPLYSLFRQSSTDFSILPFSSRIFRSLSFAIVYIIFWPIIPKNVPNYSSNVTFYWRAISDSRMFIVPILTWLIRNTVSVNWNILVRRVATIHKNYTERSIIHKIEFVSFIHDYKSKWSLFRRDNSVSFRAFSPYYGHSFEAFIDTFFRKKSWWNLVFSDLTVILSNFNH